MDAQPEVLIASADSETRRTLASILSQWGVEPIFCSTVRKAKAILARQAVPLVFCEDRLADGSFRDLLSERKVAKLKARVAVIFRMADGNGYLEAIHLGAFNAIRCSFCLANVQRVIFHAMSDGHPSRLAWEIT
jgi:DNA-binding NtrC family response regulator